jgi:hypothetical protein
MNVEKEGEKEDESWGLEVTLRQEREKVEGRKSRNGERLEKGTLWRKSEEWRKKL